ncbi:PREDICTED: uncharacterized protein LOC106805712 [Priapulus caudatus]|uniref:Uncharacterized protein LOC106805712 n=1 Tax=Priapulus caudatus TaxID=37621 RepID=A0ABM1DSI0_PRICU|nr:PREDICTED: uncharacterized protein LOC106805712 [Priapulus caudatus]
METDGEQLEKQLKENKSKKLITTEQERMPALSTASIQLHPTWRVPVKMQRYEMRFLVDSVSSATLLNTDQFNKIKAHPKQQLSVGKSGLKLANGDLLEITGETEVHLEIAERIYKKKVMVAQLGDLDEILGLDFLVPNNAIFNMASGMLSLNGQDIQGCWIGGEGGRPVYVEETTKILPGIDSSVPGWTYADANVSTAKNVRLIPSIEFKKLESRGIQLKETVLPREVMKVPLVISHAGERPVLLVEDQQVGQLKPIEEEATMQGQERVNALNAIAPGQLEDHLRNLLDRADARLELEKRSRVTKTLYDYRDIFAGPGDGLGRTSIVKHKIDTGHARTIKQPPRRVHFHRQADMNNEIEERLKKGVIELGNEPWASPVVLVTKKDREVRFCVDYRKVNQVIRKDAFPLSRMDNLLDALSGAYWFATLDLAAGYWQVEMDEESKDITGFSTKDDLWHFV